MRRPPLRSVNIMHSPSRWTSPAWMCAPTLSITPSSERRLSCSNSRSRNRDPFDKLRAGSGAPGRVYYSLSLHALHGLGQVAEARLGVPVEHGRARLEEERIFQARESAALPALENDDALGAVDFENGHAGDEGFGI